MATLDEPGVRELLAQPNYAVISTLNANGSIHSTVVWISAEDGAAAVNSAVGRLWPTNLERDPRVTVLVFESGNPYHFLEIRGTAEGSIEGADEHINRLTKKYIGQDEYPNRQPGEQRIKFVIKPDHIRHVKMG
jgi:PPOX class probable F420-dependent enzyme